MDFDTTFTDMCLFCLQITSGTACLVLEIFSILRVQIPNIILDSHSSTFNKQKHLAHYA